MTKREISGIRVRARREELGISQQSLAGMLGITQQSIQSIEGGKVRRPRVWDELADALSINPVHLERELPLSMPEDPFVRSEELIERQKLFKGGPQFAGFVQSGTFRTLRPTQLIGGHDWPLDPTVLELPQYAWIVSEDGMDLIGIDDGSTVVGVLLDQYIFRFGTLRNGLVAVVERLRDGGNLVEVSLKEVAHEGRIIRLVPRSSNANHETLIVSSSGDPITTAPPTVDDGTRPSETKPADQVRIVGLVMMVVKRYGP